MAVIREASLKFDGTVRQVTVDRDDKGNNYGTVQVENADGISDVSFNAQDTINLGVSAFQPGMPVAWIVRPYTVFGISKRSGAAYGFTKLTFVRDQLSSLGASLD